MKRPLPQPGFTLIELLIAAVLLVVVALLATATLVSTVRLQDVHRRSQTTAAQAKKVLSEIVFDLESSAGNTVRTYTFKDTASYSTPVGSNSPNYALYPDDTLLLVSVPLRNSEGIALAGTEMHAYCAQLLNVDLTNHPPTGKRLVRYVIPSTYTYTAATAAVASPNICATTFIQSIFGMGVTVPTTEYLGDQYLQVLNLRFWPVWEPTINAASYDLNPEGVRTELSVQFNYANDLSPVEQRASDSSYASPPLVLRTLTSRRKAFNTNN